MTNVFSKTAMRAVAICGVMLLAAALLTSCMGGEKAKTPAQLNREYMAAVNQGVDELGGEMDVFAQAVVDGDVAAMRMSADRASKIVEGIESLKAPEMLQQVHASYVSGANLLLGALDDYVDLYAGMKAGTVSESEAASEIESIRTDYGKGVAQLEHADSLVVEISGVEKKSDSAASKDQTDAGKADAGQADAGQAAAAA